MLGSANNMLGSANNMLGSANNMFGRLFYCVAKTYNFMEK